MELFFPITVMKIVFYFKYTNTLMGILGEMFIVFMRITYKLYTCTIKYVFFF